MLTRKQAGCFYRAYKEGKLNKFDSHIIGLMYEVANNGFSPSQIKGALFFERQFKTLNEAMENLFAEKYEEAQEKMFQFLTCGKFASLDQYLNL